MAYISGIEACKKVIMDIIDDIDYDLNRLDRGADTDYYTEERIQYLRDSRWLYENLTKTFDDMIETEINEMAEAMDGVYNV